MASHSSTLAWKIPWTKEPGRLQSMGSLKTGLSDFTFPFHFHALEKEMATNSSVLGLENLRDGEAWWAAVYGVAQSWTRLKRLSSSSSSSSRSDLAAAAAAPIILSPVVISLVHLHPLLPPSTFVLSLANML